MYKQSKKDKMNFREIVLDKFYAGKKRVTQEELNKIIWIGPAVKLILYIVAVGH